jgi:antitoxin component YwqK of YwqJK toxin-antitoxin module
MNEFNNKSERHGYWEKRYANGNLNYKGYYINDKRHGYWESYYPNGKLSWKGNFNNDVYTGYFEWYPIIINEHNRLEKEFYL